MRIWLAWVLVTGILVPRISLAWVLVTGILVLRISAWPFWSRGSW
jgi:hypothetical protein